MAPLETYELRERRNDCKGVAPAAKAARPPGRETSAVRKNGADSKWLMYAAGITILAITIFTKPAVIATKTPTAAHVWYYGLAPKILLNSIFALHY